MARIGGRNSFIAWTAGLGCAAVIVALVALVLPAVPVGVQLVGDALRAATSAPEAAGTAARQQQTSTPECRAFYTEALWAELTQRAGGDPRQDAAAPATSAADLVTALAPRVRATCTFTGINTGAIVTTVSDVAEGGPAVARATLEARGFGCEGYGGGVRCTIATDTGSEDQVVRDGIWLSTVFTGWRPDYYTERVAQQLWPQ